MNLDLTYQMECNLLFQAMVEDYCESIAKLEGVNSDIVFKRLTETKELLRAKYIEEIKSRP